jgi:transposase
MGKKKQVSSEVAAQIQILYENDNRVTDIAAVTKVSKSSVSKIISRYEETGSFSPRARSGRPRITTPRTDNKIKRMVQSNPMISSSEIRANLSKEVKTPSSRTIRHRLQKELNLRSYRPAVKPRLSAKNVADRISFCQRYKDWTAMDWEQVMFSDETVISQFNSYSSHVRRPPRERFNPKFVVPSVKNPPSLMIWGAITAKGRAGLWFLPKGTTINSTVYISILKEKLPNFMNIRGTSKFQQDNAPCHTSKAVKAWFQQQGFDLLEGWPGSSPDLNPIENVWVTMKRKVSQHNPSSLEHLKAIITEVWVREITEEYCKRLIHSMPDRIQQVLKNKGGHTKY